MTQGKSYKEFIREAIMQRKVLLISLLVGSVALMLGIHSWLRREDPPLTASGTLEARNVNVGSKVGGRVTRVLASEGDRLEANQLLVVFDDAELSARVLQARGRLEQAQANLAKMLHGSRPEEIAEAQASSGSSQGSLAQSRADLERAKADEVNAEVNYKRAQQLAAEGVFSRQSLDDATARLDMAKAQVASLEHAVAAAQGRLQAADAVQKRTEEGFRKEDIASARADVTLAEGQLKEAEAQYAEHEVRAPTAVVVEAMDVRPGDLLPPNAALAKLLEADQLYVVVYVPQTEIGKVHIGDKAEVSVDSFPNKAFPARVEQIRQQAEFLPRNVQTKEERVHQVIGVKLRVDNSSNQLRAGVNADVKFPPEVH
jgi:multidrug resistance efflux pump